MSSGGSPREKPGNGVQSHQLPRGHVAHRIRSSSGKAKEMVWGCLTGRKGEAGVEGSPEVAEEVAGWTGAIKREMGEMETGRVMEAKERSLPSGGWAGLKESRSFS